MTLTVAQVKIGLDLRMTMKCAYCSREAGSSCTVKIPNDPNFYCSDFCAHRAVTQKGQDIRTIAFAIKLD